MPEECFCCGAFAPRWDDPGYAEWVLELTDEGEYLGIVCPGCFAGEGLAFLDPTVPQRPVLVAPRGGGRPQGAADDPLAPAA